MLTGADCVHQITMDDKTVASPAERKEGILLGIGTILIILVILAFLSIIIMPVLGIILPYFYASLMCNRAVRPMVCPVTFEEAASLKIVSFFFYLLLSGILFSIGLALGKVAKGVIERIYRGKAQLAAYFWHTTVTGLAVFFVIFFLFFLIISVF